MIHLHVHTEYSFLDGAAAVTKLIDRCVDLGMDALAITDHGGMHGLYAASVAGEAKGVKIIPGCEFYVGREERAHLILLAFNNVGLKNLYALQRLAYDEAHFYYKPTVELQEVEQHSEGLVCLSACIGGLLGEAYKAGNYIDMANQALKLKKIFGPRFYIELQAIGLPEQKGFNLRLAELAKAHDIKVVVSNDPHYVNRSDFEAHDVLLAVQTNKKVNDPDRFRFSLNDFWLKTEGEIREALTYMPDKVVEQAINNTHAVAALCNAKIEKGLNLLPNIEGVDDPDNALAKLVNKGYARRFGKKLALPVVERIRYELEVIAQKGYSAYFVIYEDFVRYARENGILVGPGRGSAGGSMVAYVLGITDINPMAYGLLFERFLNPERISPPDIDSDFDYERRDELFDYLYEKYGADHTARVGATGTLTKKAAVRRIFGVFDHPQTYINKVSKASDSEAALAFFRPKHKAEFHAVDRLEDNVTNMTMHAAGIVISPVPLADVIPLQTVSKNRKMAMTQWDKVTIEKVGLYKFDLLGLRTLTVLSNVLTSLGVAPGDMSDTLNALPLDDKAAYDCINSMQMSGIFQLEGYAGKETTRKMKPREFEELIIANAICRPGVREADLYLERKTSKEKITYEHPILEEVLGNTYGCILFQEQVMLLMNKMAGWSLGRADLMRKEKDLEKHRSTWVKDCEAHGIDNTVANHVFDRFALDYMFNRSHAAAYAVITYWTAYYKAHHYTRFMAALLNVAASVGTSGAADEAEKYDVPTYLKEVKQRGFKLITPSAFEMDTRFVGTDTGVMIGLSSIANVGDAAMTALMAAQPFASPADLVARTPRKGVNRKVIAHLIKAGIFDELNPNRLEVAHSLDSVLALTDDTWPKVWNDEAKCDFEKEVYGMPITTHPLDGYNFKPFSAQGMHALCGGVIAKAREHQAANGLMCFVTLETQQEPLEVLVFSSTYAKFKDFIGVGNIVLFDGKKSKGQLIADRVRLLKSA